MQEVLVLIVFVGAVAYIINHFRQDFRPKQAGCSKGCGSCGQKSDLLDSKL